MTEADGGSEDGDEIVVARAMMDGLTEAIRLAEDIGAERLADLLEQARALAQRYARAGSSAAVH